jgi:hypothetical protein
LRTWTTNKAQAGICDQPSRDIAWHGESEDCREFQLVRVGDGLIKCTVAVIPRYRRAMEDGPYF